MPVDRGKGRDPGPTLRAAIEDTAEDPTLVGSETASCASGPLSLIVIANGEVTTVPLPDGGKVMIGRGPECDVQIDHLSVSRKHARFELGSPSTIEDLGSVNGTRVRNARLERGKPVEISVGESIDVGATMLLVQRRVSPTRIARIQKHGLFEASLRAQHARATRAGTSFALAHVYCERSVSERAVDDAFARALRPTDVVASIVPREYDVILTDATPREADEIVERLLARLGAAGDAVRIGVACFPRDGADIDELTAIAFRGASETSRRDTVQPTRPSPQDAGPSQLQRLAERIAPSSISVIVMGETGVGKEVFSETLHRLSPRAHAAFLRLHCAALSESLIESELFGYERGAFTGAVRAKPGLLETADGGTVFLDEVGELPMSIQVKLLRVIEDRQVLRVGGLKPRPIDVRFIAATNRDLEQDVARGLFRQDLFFRLNGISIVIPPLRKRIDEIDGLVRTFLEQVAVKTGGRPIQVSPEALALLRGHSWPGNIRELRNVIERAVLLCCEGPIRPEHLSLVSTPPLVAPPSSGGEPGSQSDEERFQELRAELEALERRRIVDTLERCVGSQTAAARMLGISRRTLINKIEAFGIPRPRKRDP